MSNLKKNFTIGQKIKRARQEVGLSQRELGSLLKLSDKAVSSYEVGRAIPPLGTLREISTVTYKPVTYFIGETESSEDALQVKIHSIELELAEIKQLLKEKFSK